MGLARRAQLLMMPVMRFEEASRAMWVSAGLSAEKVEQIIRDHRLEVSKYRKGEFHSATEADSYMSQMEPFWRRTAIATWKRNGAYFCYWCLPPTWAVLPIPCAPEQYLVRTGDSTWQAHGMPEDIQRSINELFELQWRQEMNG